MKQIWKYEITPDCSYEIPINGEILTVQLQHNIPVIWVLVNPEHDRELRHFMIFGTGHDIPDTMMEYVGTCQLENGFLIFHIFEIYE